MLFQIEALSFHRGGSQEAPILGRRENTLVSTMGLHQPSEPMEHLVWQPQEQASTPSSHSDNLPDLTAGTSESRVSQPVYPQCGWPATLDALLRRATSGRQRGCFQELHTHPLGRTAATGHECFQGLPLGLKHSACSLWNENYFMCVPVRVWQHLSGFPFLAQEKWEI